MPLITINGTDTQAASRGVINGNFAYLAGLIASIGGVVSESPTIVSVGPSPFTYTAGPTMETVYISGGSITSITRRGVSLGLSAAMTVVLPPGESLVVNYDTESPPASPPEGRPSITVDKANLTVVVGGSGYSGIPTDITVGPSPFTYTAGSGTEYVYISGGSINSITRRGVSLGLAAAVTVILPPGESVTVSYNIESPPSSPPDGLPIMKVDK